MRYLPALIASALAAALAYGLNLTQSLGAHPWWSDTVILIGLVPGFLIALVLGRTRLQRVPGTLLLALGVLLAFGAAHLGKMRFAASYAEDALAGQIWYFGWITTCGLTVALIAFAAWPTRRTH